MYFDYTPEQQALRDELRAYMEALVTPDLMAEILETEGGGPLYHKAMQKLGADGWLGIGWPKEHGGQERGPIEQFIFFDECQRAGFPVPILTLNTVGPTLLKYGNEEQIKAYRDKILAGKCHFSIGYTEPSSGTDLASLKTRAVREGDEWVINGQKIWTSLADHADYLWLACRTDPDAPPHAGISMIIVPADAPGVSITKIHPLGENNVHACYFDNVRVPYKNLVGKENGGWKLITSQLNHERVALNAVGPIERIAEKTAEWAAKTPAGDGQNVIDLPWVQTNLAKVYAKLEVLKLMNWQQAWSINEDKLAPADASAIKVYGSEFYVEASRLLMEIHAECGVLHGASEGSVIAGDMERFYRMSLVLTFGGGTNEIQRDIICMAGLRMPRAMRLGRVRTMDFSFSEDQQGIRALMKKMFNDIVTEDSLKALEKEGTWQHKRMWSALAESEMLGLAIPADDGGVGLGLIELCLVLQQVGHTVAPIPAIATLVSGAMPLAKYGTEAQKEALLPGVMEGTTLLSAALSEERSRNAYQPATSVTKQGEGFVLNGVKTAVPYAEDAEKLLVAGTDSEGRVGVFLVSAKSAGVTLGAQTGTNGQPLHRLELKDVAVGPADQLGSFENGAEVLKYAVDHTILAMCAVQFGIAEKAMILSAQYTSERKQFGKPIGSFQAVSQRMGDVFIDVSAIKVTMWQAAWRMQEGLPYERELAVAKFWASEAGHRVVVAAQHVHGGMGFDRDYALHRYFLNAKQNEFTLGSASSHLTNLGKVIAKDAKARVS